MEAGSDSRGRKESCSNDNTFERVRKGNVRLIEVLKIVRLS